MYDRVTGAGGDMIAISPVLADRSRALIDKHGLKFEILRDPGNEVAASYGLRWTLPDDLRALYERFGIMLPEHNGDDSWTLPLPARYIVDTAGVIRYARTDPDYTRRPEPDETIEALEQLTG